MNCCQQCQGIDKIFNEKTARKELKRYRKKGPVKTTRMLIEALKTQNVDNMTLLDIGGGIGAIQHELMDAGVVSVTNIDASSAYLETAQEESEQRGFQDKVDYQFGDFVELASQVSDVDIVTLDRVICCYHNMLALVGLSAERAKKLYGVVYPRDVWWVKMTRPLVRLFAWFHKAPFRFFVHPTREVDALIRQKGLTPKYQEKTFVWQLVVYAR